MIKVKKNNFLEGSFIATFNLVITKILGMLYVIPFYAIVGTLGGALYSYAYTLYSIFLSIGNAGIPNAISKITSEYNAKDLHEAKLRTFKLGKKILGIISIVAFIILFIFAKPLANLILGDLTGGNTIEDVTFVIRAISFALLIIPHLSVTRGYIQGHKYIETASTSQVVEQIVRIAVILLGSYFFYKIFNASLRLSVGVAVFGATVGGFFAYLYLRRKVKDNKKDLDIEENLKKDDVENKEIIKKICVYAIPFVIIAVVSNIYIFTDMVFVSRTLNFLGFNAENVEFIASSISTWGTKINMIVTSIAMGFTTSLVPTIVTSFHKHNLNDVNKKLNQALKLIYFISLPMVVGISLLATPIWTIFYNTNIYGGKVLSALIWTALTGNLLMIVSNTLQSMNKFKTIYITNGVGLLLNLLLDFPFMVIFHKLGFDAYYGAIFATVLCNILSVFIGLLSIKKEYEFKYIELTMLLEIFSHFAMNIMVLLLNPLYRYLGLSTFNKLHSIIIIIISTLIGGVIYMFASFKLKLIDDIITREELNRILKKLTRGKLKIKENN